MTDKIKIYLDGMFATIPQTDEVLAAKEELYTGMIERYHDYLAEGLDEQAAYDAVIDSIGDIRELFDELGTCKNGGAQDYGKTSGKSQDPFGINFNDIFQSISDFTTDVVSGVSGIFSGFPEDLPLVNSRNVPLEDITMIDINYITESIVLKYAPVDQMVINEYMNRQDPSLYAEINSNNGQVTVRNGRRQNLLWLRARVEVLLPRSFKGSLTVSTISGSISSEQDWKLTSFYAKSISGSLKFNDVEAAMIRLSTTSGSITANLAKGTIDAHSISGSIKIEEAGGGGTFKTTAGSIRVNFSSVISHIEAGTVSGGIRLGLPADLSFELDAKSISGSIHTAYDESLTYQKRSRAHGFVGQGPYQHVRVQTTSGGIHIND